MIFRPGDRVVHKSDKKPREMVVIAQAIKEYPPLTRHNEYANSGIVSPGSYCCTWISGTEKGEGYFEEVELDRQP